MDALVSTHELSRDFGELRAVDEVSFALRQGDVLGFLGPNGAGKSTTMRMISGTLAPSSGEVRLAGISLAGEPERAKQHLGYLPENPPLHLGMSVDEFLRYCAGIRGLGRGVRNRAVDRARERCGLSGKGDRLIRNLSKGYRQRVGIAQAIVHEPRVLILDEPTSGLDPNQIQEIRTLIRELGRERAIILSTHILPEVQSICNRVLIMRDGAVVHAGSLDTPEPVPSQLVVSIGEAPACDELVALHGVADCVPTTRPGHYRLTLCDTGSPPAVARQIVERGWSLREMTPRQESLEEIFTRLTSEEPAPRSCSPSP